jgi:hypothetical protein
MEHLLPTLLGIAGALAPVAISFWRQQPPPATVAEPAPDSRGVASYRAGSIDVIIRGGRVYL